MDFPPDVSARLSTKWTRLATRVTSVVRRTGTTRALTAGASAGAPSGVAAETPGGVEETGGAAAPAGAWGAGSWSAWAAHRTRSEQASATAMSRASPALGTSLRGVDTSLGVSHRIE